MIKGYDMANLIKGSERKFIIGMQPIDDVHLSECTIKVEIYSGQRSVMLDESCVKYVDDDSIKVIVKKEDALALGGVIFKFRIHIGIPDADFPDNYRNQIYDL